MEIKNEIRQLILSQEQGSFKFKPSSDFYSLVNINRKRWGQIYRDEKSATIFELQMIANYFGVAYKHSFSSDQQSFIETTEFNQP